jgi:error-prone DNA polymerase
VSFNGGPATWGELEAVLSGRAVPDPGPSSRRREAYSAPAGSRGRSEPGDVAYAELHCHSNFSFLDGASHPEELVEAAAALGLDAIAITDHDGMYGVVRFAQAARELGVRTVFGAELSIGLSGPQNGTADPEGEHLLLARGLEGYRRLSQVIATAQLTGQDQGRPVYDLDALVEQTRGHVVALSGCRKGAVRRALHAGDVAGAAQALERLVGWFGRDAVYAELVDHAMPVDSRRNDLLAGIAHEAGVATVATNAVHYARPERGRLADAMAAVRARRSLEEMAGWLSPASTACLRSGAEMAARMRRYPGVVARAARLGAECAFDLALVAPKLPPFDVPPGHTEDSYLRMLVRDGARQRYGEPGSAAYRQIEHELEIISQLGFPGYFLVVWDIVRFCRENSIFCQGRGSAANSAVCYALSITNADPVAYSLLFERFLHRIKGTRAGLGTAELVTHLQAVAGRAGELPAQIRSSSTAES